MTEEDAFVVADPRMETILAFAQALHAAGAPAHRLEAMVARLSRVLDVDAAVFAQPTSLMLQLDGHVHLLPVQPREVALDELVAVHHLARKVETGELPPAQALAQLRTLGGHGPWSLPTSLVAWAGASGCAAILFGGEGLDVAVAAFVSGLLGLFASRRPVRPELGRLLPFGGAFVAALAMRLAGAVSPVHADAVVLAALVVLLPGFSLTTGLTELASGHLSSGSARMAAAGTTLLQLGIGVALAHAVVDAVGLPLLSAPLSTAGPIVQLLSIVGAALCFLVLLRGRARNLFGVVAITFVAVNGTRFGGDLLGATAAPFVGALAVGLLANLYARWRDLPAQVLLVPGIIMLVPGSIGFRGVQALAVGGGSSLELARMFVVGAALVTGVLTANAVLSPRRDL